MSRDLPRIRLAWIDRSDVKRDWIRQLLGDHLEEEVVEAPWPTPVPHTLYAIDTNWNPLGTIPQSFLDQVKITPGVGIIHFDEWLNEDYSAYRSFSYVLRMHWNATFQRDFVLTLPLGFPNGGEGKPLFPAASERQHNWFFAGNIASSRAAMLKALSKVDGGVAPALEGQTKRLSHAEYLETLRSTRFIPAPMGNVMNESYRLYEALEHGAIPILEKRPALDYYSKLFGKHPIPTFYYWDRAGAYMRSMATKPEACDALQAEIADWWSDYKGKLHGRVNTFIAAGDAEKLRDSALAYHPMGRTHRKIWQYSELLKHQSWGSLVYRIGKAVRRGSIARDTSYLKGPRY